MTVGELKKNLELVSDDFEINIEYDTYSVLCEQIFHITCDLKNTFDINKTDKIVTLGLCDKK